MTLRVQQRSTSSNGSTMLSIGARGPAVADLQRRLAAAGFSPGAADGVFGPMTQRAVVNFQRAHGLAADGIAGPRTEAALRGGGAAPARPASGGGGGGSVLREGSRGAQVATLQRALASKGFSPGVADGVFGPMTQRAVMSFQRAHGLSVDGVVGPQTWGALGGSGGSSFTPGVGGAGGSASSSFRNRILDIAKGELGLREVGNNGGPITKYPNYFGRGAESWCADYVSWVVTKAGGHLNDPWTVSQASSAASQGRWKGMSNPQPGDLVYFNWERNGRSFSQIDHVGIVVGVNSDGTVRTIEGNASAPGGGQGVAYHNRSTADIVGYASPPT
ncbi:MAG: peptidoglycan-binding protein [Myxococcaceae bacterium]